jgi:hypothetical protein
VKVMSEIRNQLQTLTGAEILSSQLSTVGGKVFTNAEEAQTDLVSLTKWWRSIHAPTYGVPIPSSSKTATGTAAVPTMLDPAVNETAYVVGASLTNGSGSDASTATVTIGGAVVWVGTVAPSSSATVVGFQGISPFYLVGGQALGITQTGASASDITFAVAYSLAVQG